MRDPFRGFFLVDVAIWGTGFGVLASWLAYTLVRVYNWASRPAVPANPLRQAEHAGYIALSVALPVIVMGHLFTALEWF
jgi:hypothetical protein